VAAGASPAADIVGVWHIVRWCFTVQAAEVSAG
jgi:hypothetical protein